MENKTIMQYFEWDLPADKTLWKRCVAQAYELKKTGIDIVWLPPAYKGAAGDKSVGYDVYDTYDLGEFDQKGSVATKYGTKDEYLSAVKTLQDNGIEVFTDIVLNHMMGADEVEEIVVDETLHTDREHELHEEIKIKAWTKFNFNGRAGKYSDFCWNASHFSGTDWDADKKRKGIFRFADKEWNKQTDSENVNFDYLMGVDLDTNNDETVNAVTDWGKWYVDTVKMNGFRLDAVKHIGTDFYRKWLKDVRGYAGVDMPAVGEYWSGDLNKLLKYLEAVDGSMMLFDVPLHFALCNAATSNGQMDMSQIFSNTLVNVKPASAVTFVDNHDTQPGQALCSFIPEWFKQTAYALILLRQDGLPCVFYGDYYGMPAHKKMPVAGLKKLLAVRRKYAYGQQIDYFDNESIVGFTRLGDEEHVDSAVAVIFTDTVGGSKRMCVGKALAGERFYDVLGNLTENVVIGEDGFGEFKVGDGSVSVWIREGAYEDVMVNVE